MHAIIEQVTDRIRKRSAPSRARYLHKIESAARSEPARTQVSCTNLAHVAAASTADEKIFLRSRTTHPNIAIVSAYNDMLSAHQPLQEFPAWIKQTLHALGATVQFAGGVPAMCDGITQGQVGMELSLFSRDVIALSASVALSHNVFDGVLMLGVCDKIVPGLVIAALSFGHLPAIFIPAGPMPSGISNSEKAAIRKKYALGQAGDEELLDSEMKAYHAPGTCTFYGTANSNQMLMEVMGLHLPGSAFVPPHTELRKQLTCAAAARISEITALTRSYQPVGQMLDERSFVNAAVTLIATGGSSNHALHIPAMARAAGIKLDWEDMEQLSKVVPIIANIYPNGSADINQFHQAGGTPFVIKELLSAGLLHNDVQTVMGRGLAAYTQAPDLNAAGQLNWSPCPISSADASVLRNIETPFQPEGGLRLVTGNLGRGIQKTSALPPH
ncbi:MAG TPA: dihydroxy-acid dehydratase, partial [Pseudomonadales bacterium]|nr:dihydroxy-acid dehydratase [Pseudomonadales bacterium]